MIGTPIVAVNAYNRRSDGKRGRKAPVSSGKTNAKRGIYDTLMQVYSTNFITKIHGI